MAMTEMWATNYQGENLVCFHNDDPDSVLEN